MTPQELKNSILQLAIQGKLVEQRPDEGTAEELYKQIQAEKQALIKAGKIKKDRRTDALDIPKEDEIPFDIPETWKWTYLGSILNKLTDGTHRTPKYSTSGVKFVSVKDMSSGVLYLNNTKFITESEHEELFARCDPVKGDMLLSKVGTTGVPAIVDTDEPFSLFVSVALLKYSHSCMDEAFLYYLLKSPLVQLQAAENTRGVGNKNWVLDAIAKTVVVLPPLAEQKRIVAKIEELLPLIDRYEKAWSRLEDFNKRFPGDMQKSILQMAIQGKLVEQRPEEGTGEELYRQIKTTDSQELEPKKRGKRKSSALPVSITELPFEIPDSWIWVRLGTIGYTNIGLTYSPKDVSGEGTIVLRSSNIQNGLMDYEDIVRVDMDIPENKICCKGDILICARNGSKRLVGKSAIIDRDGMSFGAFMAIFRSPCNEYIIHVINSAYFRNSLLGETGTTTINQITQDMLKNALIPLPPLAEQKRIVSRLEELLPLCERLK